METINKPQREIMIEYAWDTFKPLFITALTWSYAFFNANVITFFQALAPSEQYPAFDVTMYFVIKISSAISGLFGAIYIMYRFIVFYRKQKK